MVKKQQLAVGGLSSLFSSRIPLPTHGAVLMPCRHSSASSSMSSSSAWQWSSCGMHPRTLSFRQLQEEEEDASRHGRQNHDDDSRMAVTKQQAYYKAMNSYSVDSCFSTNSLDSVDSFSTAPDDLEAEAVLRAVRSDRLLFEPDEDASSFKALTSKPNKKLIIKAPVDDKDDMADDMTAFGGAIAMSMESENPYRDFRESMEAMVMSHQGGVKDWFWLEEMLGWYLRANGKSTHGLIVGAFVDLLVALSSTAASPADSSSSPATPAAAGNCYSGSDCSCSSCSDPCS